MKIKAHWKVVKTPNLTTYTLYTGTSFDAGYVQFWEDANGRRTVKYLTCVHYARVEEFSSNDVVYAVRFVKDAAERAMLAISPDITLEWEENSEVQS